MFGKSLKYVIPLLLFFVAVVLVKRVFNLSAIELLLGGVIGLYLPDLDHLIYVYILRPTDLTSQRVRAALSENKFSYALSIICDTHNERGKLIFHTALFQIIFFALSFLVITSSGSLFGRGLVLAVLVHLLVDQWIEMNWGRGAKSVSQNVVFGQEGIQVSPGLGSWFVNFGVVLERRQEKVYFWTSVVVVLLLGLLF